MADNGEVSGPERGTVGRERRGGRMVYIIIYYNAQTIAVMKWEGGAKLPWWTGFLYIPTDRVTRTRLIKIRCVGALDL